jgi:high-affinity Fe2+/Pb2+ permease
MSDNTTWHRSNNIIGAALAVLVVFQVFFLFSDLGGAVRYGVGGAIAIALVLGVYKLSSNRRES